MGKEPEATPRQSFASPTEILETVFKHANDAIFIVDIGNDSIVDCNPAAEELVEYSREELLSMPASDLHPHNISKFMEFADTVLEEGEGWTDEITCYCKSGDILPAEMSASVVEIDDRPHLINHIRETTDREERDWFEALIEHSSDLITVVKADGTIQYQSSSVDHILGYEPNAVRQNCLYDYIHPDDEQQVRERFDILADRDEGTVTRIEYRFRCADGSWSWLDAVVSYRPDTTISGYIINARDITRKKESTQQATVLNRVLRHNIRNDLNVIITHAELMQSDPGNHQEYGELIVSKAWDLYEQSAYTKDIADILAKSSVKQQKHDVTEIIETTVEELRKHHTAASFETEIPDVQVHAAPKLDIALDHLLRNAIEHNDAADPQVCVTVQQSNEPAGTLHIQIKDNGPGIPEQERAVLLEGEETALEHGSGLGLWISNWIINRSGGRISFAENEPRGSQVTVSLQEAN
jgi:PAS domain S-box-containing protein